MKYEYCQYNPEYFATALRRDNSKKKLIWDNARGQGVVIVQTPFGENAEKIMPDICKILCNCELRVDGYTEIKTGIWVRFVSPSEKARNNGCQINGEASTYTVFGYSTENDITKIYEPKNQGMISSHCNVPLEMHVSISKVTKVAGFLKKKNVDTGFYEMIFPSDLSESYMDGSISYLVEEMSIPITRLMVKQRTIYVKSQVRPEVISNNKGLRLV